MLLKSLYSQRPLLFKTRAPIIIYLRDHDKLINPQDSRLNLSYSNPKKLAPNAPAHKFINYKLQKGQQQLLDRQIFQEYKNKLLRGIIDEVSVKEPDPLWGEDEVPIHYYNRTSKIDLMRVSHPQNADAEAWLASHYEPYFSTNVETTVDKQLTNTKNLHQLVQISVAARRQQINEMSLWFTIQEGFKRGRSLHLLNSHQLIKLKWAFDGLIKQGTPVFHQILSSLLREDIPKMSKEQLIHLFYACRHSNPGKTNLQDDVLERLRNMYSQFTFQQKVSFLLAFSVGTKGLKLGKKVYKRRRYQYQQKAASVLLQLDLWDLPLTNQTAAQLIFALSKLYLENTKFITYPIRDFVSENLESYGSDIQRLYQAIVYMPQLQGGEGVLDQDLATRLRGLAQQRWSQFSKIQQIRIVHSLWNLGLMDEGLLQLYKAIQFEADSSLMYYAAQIELSSSSQREWQIIQGLTAIDYLPLPYYIVYKRFFNYIKNTTNWNLTPLEEKLINLQYHYNAMRQYDSLYKIRHYRKMRQFEAFSEVRFSNYGNPIQNLQLAHFAHPIHQVSLDIITKRQMIPGTTKLKETFKNKMRSLKNIGWKHIVFTQDQLKNETLFNIIGSIQKCYQPYAEAQKAIIDYQDYREAEKLELYRQMDMLKELQIEDLNQYFSIVEQKENIILGNDAVDDETEESIEKMKKGTPPPK